MKKVLFFLCLFGGWSLCAQAAGLNITGEPEDAVVNSVEVDPTPVSISGSSRALWVRT